MQTAVHLQTINLHFITAINKQQSIYLLILVAVLHKLLQCKYTALSACKQLRSVHKKKSESRNVYSPDWVSDHSGTKCLFLLVKSTPQDHLFRCRCCRKCSCLLGIVAGLSRAETSTRLGASFQEREYDTCDTDGPSPNELARQPDKLSRSSASSPYMFVAIQNNIFIIS